MKCPVDKSDMMVVEHRKIELDYCMKCSGVWLDSGEMELLVALLGREGGKPDAELTPHTVAADEAKRKCPICRRKMDKVSLGNRPKAVIDRCSLGHGLWFDRGELQRVMHELEQPGLPEADDLLGFLNGALKATHTHAKEE